MKKLLPAFRNVGQNYSKRVICSIDLVYELFKEALNEEIKLYTIIYAYDNQLYALGYENMDKTAFYYFLPDSTIKKYDNLEELKNNVLINHDITVLREFQNNMYEQYRFIPEAYFMNALHNTLNNDNIIELSVYDNIVLKNYVVTEKDNNFNYNMSDELIKEYNQLILKSTKEQKSIRIILIGCVVIIILGIALAAMFGGK